MRNKVDKQCTEPKFHFKYIPFSSGDDFVFLRQDAHKETIITDIIATVKIPAMIPRIRTTFGPFFLFEPKCVVASENCLGGASMGEIATRGAVYQMQSYINMHSTNLTSIKQPLTLGYKNEHREELIPSVLIHKLLR